MTDLSLFLLNLVTAHVEVVGKKKFFVMKKVFSVWSMAMLVAMCVGFSSCAMKTYTTTELDSNYKLKMTGKKEQVLLEKIKVFTSEKDVGKSFEVISVNRYQPFTLPWPLGNFNKKVKQTLYEKAVKEAENQKGDAIIIVDNTHFKVIRFN